jgi:hypothetical protein
VASIENISHSLFPEQGVAMLSGVLRSKRAIRVNIEIMRTFVKLRQMLASNAELARKLDAPEKKYDAQFKVVFDAIRQLMAPDEPGSGSVKAHCFRQECAERWVTAIDYLKDNRHVEDVRRTGWARSLPYLTAVAQKLSRVENRVYGACLGSSNSEHLLENPSSHLPVRAAAVRVAQRVFGESFNGSKMAAELHIARLLGVVNPTEVYLAVLNIGDIFCRPTEIHCDICALNSMCLTGREILSYEKAIKY